MFRRNYTLTVALGLLVLSALTIPLLRSMGREDDRTKSLPKPPK
jgi:hypothetical protein